MATIRPRNAKMPFEIHHDVLEESLEEEAIDESRGDMGEEELEDEEQEDYSEDDDSDDSDGVMDAAVQEDMNKFQETFEGITKRFRLINRIGEGDILVHWSELSH